jgi:hypothetical protein
MASSDQAIESAEEAPASRRCWRCLQTFACAPELIRPGPAEWWLCDPCQLALIGPPVVRQP